MDLQTILAAAYIVTIIVISILGFIMRNMNKKLEQHIKLERKIVALNINLKKLFEQQNLIFLEEEDIFMDKK